MKGNIYTVCHKKLSSRVIGIGMKILNRVCNALILGSLEVHQLQAPSPLEVHQLQSPSPLEVHQLQGPSPLEVHQLQSPSPLVELKKNLFMTQIHTFRRY